MVCSGRKKRILKIASLEYESGASKNWLTNVVPRLVEITPKNRVTRSGILVNYLRMIWRIEALKNERFLR